MVELATTEDSVFAVEKGTEVSIGADAWQPGAGARSLPVRVDAAVSGSTTGLRLPTPEVTLLGPDSVVPADIPAGDHVIRFGDGIEGFVCFSCAATVARENGGLSVQFSERTQVTVGVRSKLEYPSTLTVPPTPEGLATAVTSFAAALYTTDPRRSHPAYRDHPPLVKFGDMSIPRAVREAIPNTGIEILVPRCLKHLFVVAPLSYYLGASVQLVGTTERPRIRAPGVGFERELPRLPELQETAADILQRVVFLECLLRTLEAPFGVGADRLGVPAPGDTSRSGGEDESKERVTMSLDPTVVDSLVGGLPPAERLAGFVAVPPEKVRPHLPAWHLSTSVAPRVEHARALPYLLDRLSLVYLPKCRVLDESELLDQATDGFYRSAPSPMAVLAPEEGGGRVHGWLAEGAPIDAFKATSRAHEHRLAEQAGDLLSAVVVVNDPQMSEELAVANIYRNRAGELPVDVCLHQDLSQRELAGVLRRPYDFLHFVGHCEDDGLQCLDGYLAAEDLNRVRTRTFFLNACRSYDEGLELVERGAVAGGVTLAGVLNEPAVTVGTAFARLLIHGFGIDRALRLARRRVVMGTDYAVVGDGTFAPAPQYGDPAVIHVTETGSSFGVSYEVFCSWSTGRRYRDPFGGTGRLYGTPAETTLDRRELAAFLADRSVPVVYDGDLRWAGELAVSLLDQ